MSKCLYVVENGFKVYMNIESYFSFPNILSSNSALEGKKAPQCDIGDVKSFTNIVL